MQNHGRTIAKLGREYNRELRDARSDYRKEMIEKGYILRRGVVTIRRLRLYPKRRSACATASDARRADNIHIRYCST